MADAPTKPRPKRTSVLFVVLKPMLERG